MGVIKININTIVNYINERLAGEQLLYSQLLVFLDGTIDDINQALNSNFPAFSEFSEKDENYPDYNFFPDRYIRTVVVTGACAKFYICDEEGAAVAEQYQYEYKEKLFLMVRDYSHQVPEEYRAEHQGYMIDYTSKECNCAKGDAGTSGSGGEVDLSGYAKKSELSTVATSGLYSDLTGKPTKLSEFENDLESDVNIRDYGAKCDGITDDTEAIKRAINKIKESNAKCSLNLTYGTILISENIVIPPLLKVYGQGIYKTTIKAKEGVSIVLDVTTDGIYNNEFYDFTIDGSNISNIKGIYFDDKNGTVNDENCKFENILIVNCTQPLIIGNNNRGNRFNNINIEHCINGLVINGTDNMLNNITLSSIINNGIEINGSNNHLSMCKVFYADKVGCVVNGKINVLDIEVQENGLNGIEINGFLNNLNVLADTNGRISPSHNIKIDGYKNIINGVCLFNSYLNGNIDTHINILNGVINELNIICHGNKQYLTEGCISPSNKILINNKQLVKNIAKEGMVFEHFGTGTSNESYNYLYNAPSFYNINTQINEGCYYKKEINITGNNKYSAYLKALVKGGACKIILSFYNSDSLISEISSEELNIYHNHDDIVFLNGDFPLNANKVVFNIKTFATTQDGYSESVIIDYGFTIF